ncbi:MAG: HNH endonuclease, partial [Malacoplasma sp.]|nr:HNH endonuclease [Malacoplasma sp.]
VILGFYYFESRKTNSKAIQKFTNRFNSIFKRDLSGQIISYYCSLFKNVDTSFNARPIKNDDERIENLWVYYIVQERADVLKSIYKDFKLGILTKFDTRIEANDNLASDLIICNFSRFHYSFNGDKPKDLYKIDNKTSDGYFRDLNVSFNALQIAGFKCECSHKHSNFIRKNINIPYTEGHHIIPLKFQKKFNVNLDVEANIVSLCGNCHNQLHYGRDFEEILKIIFTEERKKRLQLCGIYITYEELVSLYK